MRVLIAEDDPISRRVLQSALLKWGYEVHVVRDGHAAWEAIQGENAPRIAVLDWMMPGMDGLQLCRAVRDRDAGPYIYTILLTAKSQRDDVLEGLNAGVDDYVVKPFDPRELRMRLRAGKRVLDMQAQLLAEGEVQRMRATRDPLTGLPNRLLFGERLAERVAQAKRSGQPIAMMFLDLDRFKAINDSFGHNVGDMLLKSVADRLLEVTRASEFVARMGGDEFTFVLGPIADPNDAAVSAERVLSVLSKPFAVDGHVLTVTGSIGISTYPRDGSDAETLVRNADAAMYQAKEQGRNIFRMYANDVDEAVKARLSVDAELQKALEYNQMVLHYQTRMDLNSGLTRGIEALIRWSHPKMGLVPPSQFIQMAEDNGTIEPITEWVLAEACAQNKAWQDSGYFRMDVGVNISRRVLHKGNLAGAVRKALSKTGLAPEYLSLEMTEPSILTDPDNAARVLTELKEMGVRICIDDFGAGYSSLGSLKRLPISAIKIDSSFVRNIATSKEDMAIVRAIVAMGHSLDIKLSAEGVETLEQLELLRSMGCDEVQGYFISRPVSSEEVIHLLAEGNPPIANWVSLAA